MLVAAAVIFLSFLRHFPYFFLYISLQAFSSPSSHLSSVFLLSRVLCLEVSWASLSPVVSQTTVPPSLHLWYSARHCLSCSSSHRTCRSTRQLRPGGHRSFLSPPPSFSSQFRPSVCSWRFPLPAAPQSPPPGFVGLSPSPSPGSAAPLCRPRPPRLWSRVWASPGPGWSPPAPPRPRQTGRQPRPGWRCRPPGTSWVQSSPHLMLQNSFTFITACTVVKQIFCGAF